MRPASCVFDDGVAFGCDSPLSLTDRREALVALTRHLYRTYGIRTAFLRYDRFDDPNPDAGSIDYLELDPRAKYSLVLAGVDYAIVPQVRFSPNVEWVTYGTLPNGSEINDDVVWRATFYVAWP